MFSRKIAFVRNLLLILCFGYLNTSHSGEVSKAEDFLEIDLKSGFGCGTYNLEVDYLKTDIEDFLFSIYIFSAYGSNEYLAVTDTGVPTIYSLVRSKTNNGGHIYSSNEMVIDSEIALAIKDKIESILLSNRLELINKESETVDGEYYLFKALHDGKLVCGKYFGGPDKLVGDHLVRMTKLLSSYLSTNSRSERLKVSNMVLEYVNKL